MDFDKKKFSNFWAKKGNFCGKYCFRTSELVKRKKWFFALWSGGIPLPTP